MTDPAQPPDHPHPESTVESAKQPASPHHPTGIPPDAAAETPTGTPNSDRHQTETAGNPT